jgi:hypothetical protein
VVEDSDVRLVIPEEAIPVPPADPVPEHSHKITKEQTREKTIEVNDPAGERGLLVQGAISVDLTAVSEHFHLQQPESICTPIAEYNIDTDKEITFERSVKIILPHFLPLDYDARQVRAYHFQRHGTSEVVHHTLTLLQADDSEDIDDESEYFEAKFYQLGSEMQKSGAFYVSREHCIVVLTTHFSGFFCTYCGETHNKFIYLQGYGPCVEPATKHVDVLLVAWDCRLHILDFSKVNAIFFILCFFGDSLLKKVL